MTKSERVEQGPAQHSTTRCYLSLSISNLNEGYRQNVTCATLIQNLGNTGHHSSLRCFDFCILVGMSDSVEKEKGCEAASRARAWLTRRFPSLYSYWCLFLRTRRLGSEHSHILGASCGQDIVGTVLCQKSNKHQQPWKELAPQLIRR